jgi:hypothetical protein
LLVIRCIDDFAQDIYSLGCPVAKIAHPRGHPHLLGLAVSLADSSWRLVDSAWRLSRISATIATMTPMKVKMTVRIFMAPLLAVLFPSANTITSGDESAMNRLGGS